MWTKFYPILTTCPLRINNCGHFTYYQSFIHITKHGIPTTYLPLLLHVVIECPTTNETLRMFNLTKNCVKCLGGASIGHVPLNSGPTERFKSWLGYPYMMGMICPPPLVGIKVRYLPKFGWG